MIVSAFQRGYYCLSSEKSSATMDDWVAKQCTLRRSSHRLISMLWSNTTQLSRKIQSTGWKKRQATPTHRGSGQWQANHNTYPQPETFQLRPRPNVTLGSRPTKRESVRSRSNHRPQRQSQPKIDHGVQSPLGKIRCILRQLGALQCPLARRQATRLPDPMQ